MRNLIDCVTGFAWDIFAIVGIVTLLFIGACFIFGAPVLGGMQ